jgi:hypothetical protein
MLRKALLIAFAVSCAFSALAQTTQITASHIAYFGGAPVTGSFCVTPTDSTGNPINLVTSTGQQFAPNSPLCFPITNGVLSNSAIVADTSLAQPVNACYKLTAYNNLNQQIANYPCLQPSGATWSFDAYVPSSLPSTTALTLPQFQLNGTPLTNQGTINFIASGASASGGNITLPSGGASTNSENLTFSATPTFSTTYTSSRIALSGNITAFSLGSGSDGQNKCLNFAHDSSSTAYTVNPPANVHGFFSVGATPSKNNAQCFTYFVSDAAWIATSPGVINE